MEFDDNKNQYLHYIEQFQQVMNNPQQYLAGNQPNSRLLLEILQYLCQNRINLRILMKGSWECSICKLLIGKNQENLTLQCCFHSMHKQCLVQQIFRVSEHLDETTLKQQMKCSFCQNQIPYQIIIQSVGEQKFNQIQITYVQKIDDENYKVEREKRQKKLDNKTEACLTCMEEYKYIDMITLECDHRFCQNCMKIYVENQIAEGKFSNKEMVCCQPVCQKTIDIYIIKSLISKELFDKYERFVMKNLESENKDIKFAYCPMADCAMIVEYNVNENIFLNQCINCKTKFCIRGCAEPHEGKTCKEYFDQQQLQLQNQQQFDELVRQGVLKVCPNPDCRVNWIQNGGCAYVVCFKCKKPICLRCNPMGVMYGNCPCGRWHG